MVTSVTPDGHYKELVRRQRPRAVGVMEAAASWLFVTGAPCGGHRCITKISKRAKDTKLSWLQQEMGEVSQLNDEWRFVRGNDDENGW